MVLAAAAEEDVEYQRDVGRGRGMLGGGDADVHDEYDECPG